VSGFHDALLLLTLAADLGCCLRLQGALVMPLMAQGFKMVLVNCQ
jgi:hypothetical protein